MAKVISNDELKVYMTVFKYFYLEKYKDIYAGEVNEWIDQALINNIVEGEISKLDKEEVKKMYMFAIKQQFIDDENLLKSFNP